MKRVFLFLVLFCIIGVGTTIAQSVRIDFYRYKTISYYNGEWESWPVKWNTSGAYAIISNVYDDTYKVSVYKYNGELLVTSVCTFSSKTTSEKRRTENQPYLNCYVDSDGDQIWTDIVSLESLLENVKTWEQEDAALYIWVFSADTPLGIICE